MDLYPRYVEFKIKEALQDTPVVCLIGARQTGKTTLARRLAPKREYISFDDENLVRIAQEDPIGFVQGLSGSVILDEIQRVPELLPAIKMVVDEDRLQKRTGVGRFLLTGSANLMLLPRVSESLAGRIQIIRIYPLTELEKQRKHINLFNELVHNKIKAKITPHRVDTKHLAKAICSGGYPDSILLPKKQASTWYDQYLQAIVKKDIKDIAAIRDDHELSKLVELVSLRTGTLLNLSALANELKLDRETVDKYISVLEKLFLIRRLPAWHTNRTKRLIRTPKMHIVDTGLGSALNALNPDDWTDRSDEFGHLLESFVIQQLICQASWDDHGFRFYHYRDKDKNEVDLIIERGQSVWGVEVKRSGKIGSKDANGLARFTGYAGKNYKGSMLLYGGNATYAIKNVPNCYAVPLSRLWKE